MGPNCDTAEAWHACAHWGLCSQNPADMPKERSQVPGSLHQVGPSSSSQSSYWRHFLFFVGHPAIHAGSYLPDQVSIPRSLQWDHRVLATGPPGKSLNAASWWSLGKTSRKTTQPSHNIMRSYKWFCFQPLSLGWLGKQEYITDILNPTTTICFYSEYFWYQIREEFSHNNQFSNSLDTNWVSSNLGWFWQQLPEISAALMGERLSPKDQLQAQASRTSNQSAVKLGGGVSHCLLRLNNLLEWLMELKGTNRE